MKNHGLNGLFYINYIILTDGRIVYRVRIQGNIVNGAIQWRHNLNDDNIIIIPVHYYTTSTILNLILTTQCFINTANIYVRKGDGTNPPDNTVITLDILVLKY